MNSEGLIPSLCCKLMLTAQGILADQGAKWTIADYPIAIYCWVA
jgi:hypothetical protein